MNASIESLPPCECIYCAGHGGCRYRVVSANSRRLGACVSCRLGIHYGFADWRPVVSNLPEASPKPDVRPVR